MRKTLKIRLRNLPHLGYGECSRCGGNWGWKKSKTHMTSDHSGVFLFCEDCDKVVTIEERWEALDDWKAKCIHQIYSYCRFPSKKELEEEIKTIEDTEFLEFPRA